MPPERQPDLMKAVCAGDRETVARLLDRNPALLHSTDPTCFGATALIHAVTLADRPMIDLLLERGIDIDARSDWEPGSFGALDHADPDTSAYLLSRGATLTAHAAARLGMRDRLAAMLDDDPALIAARGGDGQLPLHFAADPETAALLLERGAEIDARDIDHHSTAAQWAATERPEVTRFLLSRGAEPDLFMACLVGDARLAQRLAAADPDGVNARITYERFGATDREAFGIYHFTVGADATPLHAAAVGDHPHLIHRLIDLGADPDARGGYDDATPLHLAAWHDAAEAAAALLDRGAAIDTRSGRNHNNTPLGWAIVAGSVRVVGLLLDRGAAVLDFMPADARAGADGEFRRFKRGQPVARWVAVRDRLAAHQPGA